MTGRPENKQREGVSRKAGGGRRVRRWLQPAAPRYTLRVTGGWRLAGHAQTGSSSSTPRQDAAVRVALLQPREDQGECNDKDRKTH